MKDIDILTVSFASVIYFIMYLVWYSKLLVGKVYDSILQKTHKKTVLNYVLVFVSIFILSYIIALFEVLIGIATFWDGVFFGLLIWFGFILTHSLFLVVSFKRNFKLFVLDNLLYLFAMMLVGGILAG
ncbi:MAG: hypothetical protein KR126chlam6_00533 [Candidatus Anoxychlamydiales bacterium]|nr:hypothetical protein [Candidatus Anoxychlamydiales bacterium]